MTEAAPPRDAIPGYDRPVVEAWLAANCPELSGPFEWVRLPGGHSNLTWRLTDSRGRQAVIRRPPLGELLPKAHDMGREFRVLSALKDTPVPSPTARTRRSPGPISTSWTSWTGIPSTRCRT